MFTAKEASVRLSERGSMEMDGAQTDLLPPLVSSPDERKQRRVSYVILLLQNSVFRPKECRLVG